MYKTVIDTRTLVTSRRNVIDDLFAGIEPETTEPVVCDSLIRTKTYTTTDYNIDQDLYNKLLLFKTRLEILNNNIEDPATFYTTFRIPKKTHGFREINAPTSILKDAQKEVANWFTNHLKILPHNSAWAYVKGRDVVGAMKEHQRNNSRWYLKIDLHDFFGSCNAEFIEQQLNIIYPFACLPQNIQTSITNSIIRLATLNDGLPQGTPLSPVLTNLLMVPFDFLINRTINSLADTGTIYKQRYVYTRYADDIIISAKCSFDYTMIVAAIKDIFNAHSPLVINEEKTRYGSNAGRNWNLGIMCNKNNELTVGYKRKQKLKATVHNYINATEPWPIEDLRWLLGEIAWINNVEPNYIDKVMEYFTAKYHINIKNKIIRDIKSYNN